MVIVNKRELAPLLGCAVPTVDAWIRKHSDFPVLQRGGSGQPWQFDLLAVQAFVQAPREAEAAGRRARADQISQLALPLVGGADDAGPALPGGLDVGELLALSRLRRLQREEAEHAGKLVDAQMVRQALTDTFGRLGRGLRAGLRRIVAEHGIPADCALKIEAAFADEQRRAVEMADRALGQPLAQDPVEHEPPALRLVG